MLRSQIQDRLEDVQEDVKQLVDQGQFDQAQSLLQQAQALTGLLKDLDAWGQRFNNLVVPAEDDAGEDVPRLRKGLKTPQSAYRVPILRALVELGGEAPIDPVLDRVHKALASQLNPHDMDTLADGKTPRWRNTAQWTRNAMREEGLIRDDTPRGVWAISEKGRRWLKEQTKG